METKTFEWLEAELNNASDEREELNNKLDRIIKHLDIKQEEPKPFTDELNDDDEEFNL